MSFLHIFKWHGALLIMLVGRTQPAQRLFARRNGSSIEPKQIIIIETCTLTTYTVCFTDLDQSSEVFIFESNTKFHVNNNNNNNN